MSLVIAVDLGTSSVKVLGVTEDGVVRSAASAAYPTHRPSPGHAEQDPADWWQATITATRTILASLGDAAELVAAVGVTGQMHGTVLVDDALRPLRPAIIWSDQRGAAAAERLNAQIGPDRMTAITGSRLVSGYQASTLSALRDAAPSALDDAASVLLPKDWLRARLTGGLTTDPGDAASTGLFDIRARTWSDELLAAAGVRAGHMPGVRESTHSAGTLTSAAAEALGLPAGIPVATGSGDAPAAALGCGAVRPGDAMLTLSTGTQAWLPTTELPADPDPRLQTFCTALAPGEGAGWARVAATLNGGSALAWAAATLGFGSDRALIAAAAGSPPGAGGLLFLPYLDGERTPLFDASARGSFVGLAARHTRADLARAVLEGVTLAGALAWQWLVAAGPIPDTLRLAGGGAGSTFWCQLVSDCYGLPVQVQRITDQSARGVAALALAMLDRRSPVEVVAGWPARSAQAFVPEPSRVALYAERRALLARGYEALRPVVARLADGITRQPGSA